MANLTILEKEIRQIDGLYSLNDLHKASGEKAKHQPSNFLRTETTKALIKEIQSSDMRSAIKTANEIQFSEMRSAKKTINGGPNRGTYVCKELVYAYAMWISPKFHLHVIRAFDQLHRQPAQVLHKKYHYPMERLNQPYFIGKSGQPDLSTSMLTSPKFASQLKQLLNELQTDGHNIDAAWEEYHAINDRLTAANEFLEEVTIMSIKANNSPARKTRGSK